MDSAHAPFHRRAPSPDTDGDVPMVSPAGSRASSVLGGGDAGVGGVPPPPRLPNRRHLILSGKFMIINLYAIE